MSAGSRPHAGPAAVARLHAWRRGARVRGRAAEFTAARGPSPAAWAWLALGAEGRRELLPPGDQDHALVLAEPRAPGQDAWARGLAEAVESDLAAAGVPPCPGGFTARHWCLGIAQLCGQVRAWLAEPSPEAVLAAAAFLDARRVAGTLDLAPLRAALAEARARPVFLRELARGAVAFAVPSPWRALRPGRTDLEREALAPIVLAARVLGAAAGAEGTGTLERLAAARAAGLVGADLARAAADAFLFLLAARSRRARGGRAVDPIGRGERAELARALRSARRLQDCAARRFEVG